MKTRHTLRDGASQQEGKRDKEADKEGVGVSSKEVRRCYTKLYISLNISLLIFARGRSYLVPHHVRALHQAEKQRQKDLEFEIEQASREEY